MYKFINFEIDSIAFDGNFNFGLSLIFVTKNINNYACSYVDSEGEGGTGVPDNAPPPEKSQ